VLTKPASFAFVGPHLIKTIGAPPDISVASCILLISVEIDVSNLVKRWPINLPFAVVVRGGGCVGIDVHDV
jgi:hypothetical protein